MKILIKVGNKLKECIFTLLIIATSTAAIAKDVLPPMTVVPFQLECGDATDVKKVLKDLGMVTIVVGDTNHVFAKGQLSRLMASKEGVYVLLYESRNKKNVCIVDFGKFKDRDEQI